MAVFEAMLLLIENRFYVANANNAKVQLKALEENFKPLINRSYRGLPQKRVSATTGGSSQVLVAHSWCIQQAHHYEYNNTNKVIGKTESVKDKRENKGRAIKGILNKVFLGGIVVLLGFYVVQNYSLDTKEEEILLDIRLNINTQKCNMSFFNNI